jgi:RNA polymerase sporulation-specific sigma factor
MMVVSDVSRARYSVLADEDVASLAKSGNGEAAEVLIGRYRGLVESKARHFFIRGSDMEDVVQEGMVGLCKAIREFQIDRSSRFRTYADLCVTRHIVSAFRSALSQKHEPLNAAMPYEEVPEATVSPQVIHDDFPWHRMTTLERDVLEGYLVGKTYREMSRELSAGTKAVDNALQRAKKKISQTYTST